MAKECRLSTDKLPLGGLPRNSIPSRHDLSCLPWTVINNSNKQTKSLFSPRISEKTLNLCFNEITGTGQRNSLYLAFSLIMFYTVQLLLVLSIMLTRPCILRPLTPHFYIYSKAGAYRGKLFVLIFCSMFCAKNEKNIIFSSKNYDFYSL